MLAHHEQKNYRICTNSIQSSYYAMCNTGDATREAVLGVAKLAAQRPLQTLRCKFRNFARALRVPSQVASPLPWVSAQASAVSGRALVIHRPHAWRLHFDLRAIRRQWRSTNFLTPVLNHSLPVITASTPDNTVAGNAG